MRFAVKAGMVLYRPMKVSTSLCMVSLYSVGTSSAALDSNLKIKFRLSLSSCIGLNTNLVSLFSVVMSTR